uniref:TIGR01244 family sulfur transferase n=1 Tax=Pararhizobium sp. IMCC3301 TaxID=3067904 RepID=UPI002740C64F|nr:TIGR01244 family sulfur transferase [Pararhizobium sp. IMCC3301]
MNIRKIDDSLSVCPQISTDDIEIIAAKGFCSIICNRPDGEADNQPGFSEIAAAADAAGLEIRYLPVISGQLQDQDIAEFSAALRDLPAPVLAYCRTGTRSAMLCSLHENRNKTPS